MHIFMQASMGTLFCRKPVHLTLLLLLQVLTLRVSLADFICDFSANHSCGIEWQSNLLPFELMDGYAHLSTSGMMVLDLKKVNLTIAPGARLITRYYPTHSMPTACLIVKFLIQGSGMVRFIIYQRNSIDRRIYEYENDWYPMQSNVLLDQFWITLTIPVDLKEGNVMFFFEVQNDGHTPNGMFAMDHIAFMYYRCPFKQMPHYPCLDKSCANLRI